MFKNIASYLLWFCPPHRTQLPSCFNNVTRQIDYFITLCISHRLYICVPWCKIPSSILAVMAVSFSPPKWYNFCTRSEAIVCLQISKNNFCLVPEICLRQCRTFVNQKNFQAHQPSLGRGRMWGRWGQRNGQEREGMGNGRGGGEAGKGGWGRGRGGWVGDLPILKYFRLECLCH